MNPVKNDAVDCRDLTKIHFEPTIRAVADPTGPVTIRAIIGKLGQMDRSVPRDNILGNCGQSRTALEGKVRGNVEGSEAALGGGNPGLS